MINLNHLRLYETYLLPILKLFRTQSSVKKPSSQSSMTEQINHIASITSPQKIYIQNLVSQVEIEGEKKAIRLYFIHNEPFTPGH